jgi:hypothetical protein
MSIPGVGIKKSSGQIKKFDTQFRKIQNISTQLLQQALGSTLSQQQFQSALFNLLEPEFDRIIEEGEFADQLGTGEARQQFLRQTIDRNAALGEQAAALGEQLSDAAKNLGTLTDTDRELISSALGSARSIGDQQIQQFVESNFRSANEVAAARGLSPSDSPVGNIRGRVAEEAVTQKGLLERELASRGSELALQLPLQRTALVGQLAGQQQGLALSSSEFQAALAQNAAANRLNLAGTAGQLGLGLAGQAGVAPGILGASRPAIAQKSFGFNTGGGT